MKKIINIFSIVILTIILSSCFTSNDDVSKVKEEILSGNTNSSNSWEKNTTDTTEDEEYDHDENIAKFEEAEKQETKKEKYSIEYLTDERFLTVDSLDNEDFLDGEVEITGTTLVSNVDKIIVNFSNVESTYPEDRYQLQTFKSGGDTFLYRAFEKYETLDDGINKYIIEAYAGDVVSKLELTLNVFEEEELEEIVKEEKIEVVSDLDIDSLPESEIYGSPRDMGSGRYTYDGIRGLELYSVGDIDLEKENDSVTSYLSEELDGWFFWNTLRNISDSEGVSFYVLRLEDDNYLYEKHYYTPNGIYGVLTLEQGTGITLDNLEERNTALKDVNDTFVITAVSDVLFKQILD